MHTILKGKSSEVVIGIDKHIVMIGEKINPTGNKNLLVPSPEGTTISLSTSPNVKLPGVRMYWISM